jgi:FlgD Ig-like domain
MLRSLRIIPILAVPLISLLPAGVQGTGLRDMEGAWARYHVEAAGIPHVDQLQVSTPRVESTVDGEAVWFQMEAFSRSKPVFAVAMLVSDLGFLRDGGAAPVVLRYLLYPGGGDPLEYVDAATGGAYLPRFGLFDGLLPLAPASSSQPLFEMTEYLGRAMVLERSSASGARPLPNLIGHHRVLSLDDRVLIGSSRSFRDDGSGRTDGDYSYVPLSGEDYRSMREAGFNLFRIPASHFGYVAAEPVFFLLPHGTEWFPDLFYRSNYRGAVMYMDEPEVRVAKEPGFQTIVEPEAAATATAQYTAEMAAGSTGYGRGYLSALTAEDGWELGPRVDLSETSVPSWLSRWASSWYQVEAGAGGAIAECRIDPVEYSNQVAFRFGVDFPAEPEPWIRFLLGMEIGATQHFGGDFGISVFGQAADDVGNLAFRLAYERGARYFWLWTSDNEHHVPYTRQLEIVRAFRDWLATSAATARPREERRLVAVTLPWGYLCDTSNFNKGQQPGRLWWGSDILLDDLNAEGVPYREVLAAVYRTYLERIAAGEEVDFLYEKPGEVLSAGDYDAVYRVLATGIVVDQATAAPAGVGAADGTLDAFPNPFADGTGLRLQVMREANAKVQVFDAAGRLVRTLLPADRLPPGRYTIRWNGRNDAGTPVAGGVYFARASIDGAVRTEKMVRLR